MLYLETIARDGPSAREGIDVPDNPSESPLYGPLMDAEKRVEELDDPELVAEYYLLDESWPEINIRGLADYSAAISELRRRNYTTDVVDNGAGVVKNDDGDVVRPVQRNPD
jgi:hypothetical protein